MIYELRRYQLNPENKTRFYQRFNKKFLPIARKYGLTIIGAWDVDSSSETVYILAWPDIETMRSTWQKVLADESWIETKVASKKQYGDLVLETFSETLLPTSYSQLQ